jgi:isochorismate synthase
LGNLAGVEYLVEELADATGVAVDTVRYYQREKLLHAPRREGRRVFYDEGHLDRIRQIKSLAQQGFSLAQIRDLSTVDASGLLVELADQNAVDPELDKSELARRADVPEFIIDVVVSAGLLTPVGDGDEQRFAADAVDMLVAARTLVSEGVSLEELTALAMRHATHIEDVVDDAIELFKRNSDAKGRDRNELVGLMHRLVPVASKLVGGHFERTLRTRALARLGGDTSVGGGVMVFARKLDDRVDPVAVYGAATDHFRSLWVRPDDGFALVALGAAEVIEPHGDSRFSAASAARAALGARIRRHGPAHAPAPVLVGGFSFSCGNRPVDPDWTGFPDARWILPEVTVVDRYDGSWLLAATSLAEGDDETAALDLLEARLEEMASAPAPATPVVGEIVAGDVVGSDPDYVRIVADAIAEIRLGALDKVVLARTLVRGPIATSAVLRGLVDRFPACATFAFGVGNRAFIGASPERLVTLDGREVSTVALAGTTGTGTDDASDATLAAEMLASPKIRSEHQFVVDDITARLATLGLVGETPDEPEIMRLARVQHLRTPITARVERRAGGVSDMDVLRVANVLHPSPAVGGTPSDPAVRWLRQHEDFDRGWYAAPVGWCDLDGNGELRVALRSALVDESQVTLFSGAGIVADSTPEDELAETSVKLRALLDVMESATERSDA